MNNGFIIDWGISQTTLEEVFLRLTHGDSHTFKENEKATNISYKLDIAFNDEDNIIGTIKIDEDTTLKDIREEISEKFSSSVPSEYYFISNKQPIQMKKERSIPALKYIPLLIISDNVDKLKIEYDDDDMPDIKPINIVAEESITTLKLKIKDLELKLEKSEYDKKTLLEKIDKKRKKIKDLKMKLSIN